MKLFITIFLTSMFMGVGLFAESPQTGKVAAKYFTPKISVGVASAHAESIPTTTLAQAAAPAPQEEVKPGFFDNIIDLLKNHSGSAVAGLLMLAEILFKVFPSVKPLSVLLPVKYVVDSLSAILLWLSNTLLIPLINIANNSDEKLKPKV